MLKDRLRSILREDKAQDPQVWSALLDLAFKDSGPLSHRPRKLRFLALSDRARAKVIVQESQSELIAQLIQRSITSTAFRRDIAKTLFTLLIPPDLKDSLLNQDRVVFILDDVTANYPWELMIATDQPLCVCMGMIRQLETADYVERVRDTTSTSVYVVGDPLTPSNYPELHGARKEADLVASLLKEYQYTVNHSSQRLSALEVLNQLFAQPYRIIHIAGHGYYSEADIETSGAKAGVVLDNGLFLTAAEIAMLDPIPELVFLNCCYLGQIGGTAYNKLAASISRELIRKGVRAVVAAGWPVRDDAALCFAQTFYKQLLEDQPFGQALQKARQQTWTMFPESNTWGAYQAYGDPEFRLRRKPGTRKGDNDEVMVAAEEVLIKLDELSGQDEDADSAPPQDELVKLERKCASDWLKQGNVQGQFGLVYGEHGLFQQAVKHYGQAAGSEDLENPSTLRSIEQWITLLVRLGGEEGNKAKIEEAIVKGGHLLGIAKTSERLNIMGSAYKKLAQVETDRQKVEDHLRQSAAYYREAANSQRHDGVADPYPIINLLVVEALLRKEDFGNESLLSKCESLAQQRFRETRSVSDSVTIPDVALIRAFLRRSLPQERDSLVEKYRSAFAESSATQREQDSALKQMKFVRDILKKIPYSSQAQKTIASTIESLDYIQGKLQQRVSTAEPSASETKQKVRSPRSPKPSAKRPVRKNPVREKKTRRPKRRGKGKA